MSRGVSDSSRPPSLVLRFAILSAGALAIAAAVVLSLTRSYATKRAEDSARFHTSFIAASILGNQLRPSDFTVAVSPARLAELDRLMTREVLLKDALRAKLYSPQGFVTYSNDHGLIGTRPSGDEVQQALSGKEVSDVTHLDAEGGTGPDPKVLETYVAVRLDGRTVGVFELYQNYAPIAAAARAMFLPLAAVLAFVLLTLYVALFPILHRATRRLRRQMEEIEQHALYDALTGLPNRELFRMRMEEELRAESPTLAILLLDLDRFKEINDTLGHESGDLLLREAGRRLVQTVRASDVVARLGGDEFAVLAPGVEGECSAIEMARRLRRALETPLALRGLALEVEASIGIALVPDHGSEVDALLRRAEVAMYQSKDAHSGAEVYSRERDGYTPDRLRLVGELRAAMAQGQLVLQYQPQVSLAADEVLRLEALVRWNHSELGLLPPDRFIPLAEHTGLIRPLTRHVLEQALRQARVWSLQGVDVGIAVNLSGRDVLDLSLPAEVAELLARSKFDAGRLELEITENMVLSDPLRTRGILNALKELGVRIAIDDFGAGYSSLGYLRRLPLDVLKIDKTLILNMLADEDDAAIVRSTIEFAHSLGLEVVAEGVENEETRAMLTALGCDVGQGYHFSRPLAPADVPTWLAEVGRRPQAPGQPVEAA